MTIKHVELFDDRSSLVRALNSYFDDEIPVKAARVQLLDEGEQLKECYEVVVTDLNRHFLASAYVHAPRWLRRGIRKDLYRLPVCWCREVRSLGGVA